MDMNGQGLTCEDYDPNCEEEEEDEDPRDIEDYYVGVASDVEQQGGRLRADPEEYQFVLDLQSQRVASMIFDQLSSVLKGKQCCFHLPSVIPEIKSKYELLLKSPPAWLKLACSLKQTELCVASSGHM